ncbi:MAG TPA: uracil-DNA glycosylase [Caulobacteraceae bacterium]|nr:uracil-DNA glycosylase [Caulobacteraceae bacterium]
MTLDRRAARSLLAFWADAGVENLYEADPVDRTRREAPASVSARRAPVAIELTARSGTIDEGSLALDLARAPGDIEALAAAIASFDGCALKTQGSRQAVFYRGAAPAPVMIIGEAPGAEEDAQGAPFVGRAGRLLDLMLAAAGLEGRVFITNTVFWRPPGNRTPTRAEQAVCSPFLEKAIDLIRPKFLLLVGASSAGSLLAAKDGILSLRGRWFEWRGMHFDLEVPALPTLHPAFLLRQPSAKKLAWRDLMLLAERLDRADRP